MMLTHMDLARILVAVQDGDQSAREELFQRFYPRVRNIVHQQLQHDFRKNHRWILPLFSTGDIVQEVFVGVLDQVDGFGGGSEDAFIQYLSAVAKNRLLDALRYHEAARRDVRRQAAQSPLESTAFAPSGEDPTPSLAASLGEQLSVFRDVMDEFPDKQRRLLQLRLEGEEPFNRIAEILEIPTADAARQAFRAAKARLLVRLQARGLKPPENLS